MYTSQIAQGYRCYTTHLFLWVDHEGPPSSSSDQHSIFSGDSVSGQTVSVPLSDLKRSGQDVDDTEIIRHWDTELPTVLDPLAEQLYMRIKVHYVGMRDS